MRLVGWQYGCVIAWWLAQAGLAYAAAPQALPQAITVAATAPAARPAAQALSAFTQTGAELALVALSNVPASATLAQIAAGEAGSFTPFNPNASHDTPWERPLWLHFRIQADSATPATAWTLVLDKPFIDRAEFYARNAQGDWQMQAAGDWIAHAQWPQRSLSPQFYLPALGPGAHDFYVRVFNEVPLHFSVQLLPSEVAAMQMLQIFTLAALMLGFMVLMVLLSGALAVMYRDATYAWYALYAALNGVALVSYLGIGSYALWRESAWWAGQSILLCVMATTLVQLQVGRSLFVDRAASPRLYRSISAALLMGCGAISLFVSIDNLAFKVWAFVVLFVGCAALLLVAAACAARQASAVGMLWLLAYTPLTIAIALAVVDSFGWYALPWLPYNLPLYALLFEMPVLLIALHWHAKNLHSREVRSAYLEQIDPFTGYLAPHLFKQTLAQLWLQAQHKGQDMAVAYVQCLVDSQRGAGLGIGDAQHAHVRSVRTLRHIVREQDKVVHIERSVFAIFMPGMNLSDDLANRLVRLVTLGRMEDLNFPTLPPVRYRIVASSKAAFSGTWEQLDSTLRKKLFHSHGWSHKSIRYVRLRLTSESEPTSDLASLEELWDLAVEESTKLNAAAR